MSAPLSIEDAITKVRQFIDDAPTAVASRRWTDAQVKDALADQLSVCLSRYALDGGDRFDLETTATTDATTGAVSIADVKPLLVKQVSIVVDTVCYRIPPKGPMRRGYADVRERSLRVLYVREYELSSEVSHPLVGVFGTAANSWRGFDLWVCWATAVQLSSKDMEVARQSWISSQAAQAERDAMGRASTPFGYPMPRPEWSPAFESLSWQFGQPGTIYLSRVRW